MNVLYYGCVKTGSSIKKYHFDNSMHKNILAPNLFQDILCNYTM